MGDHIGRILEELELADPFKLCGLCGVVHDTPNSWARHDQRIEDERLMEQRQADADFADMQRARLLAQGVPRTLLDTKLQQWPAVTALAHSLARKGYRVVCLAGGVGCGKTTAVIHWLKNGRARPYFTTARALAALPPWSQEYLAADACVIDDVGTEGEAERMRSQFLDHLDHLVSHYHGSGKRLVLTTNLSMARFKELYKKRIESRFRQRGDWISLDLGDQRRPEIAK